MTKKMYYEVDGDGIYALSRKDAAERVKCDLSKVVELTLESAKAKFGEDKLKEYRDDFAKAHPEVSTSKASKKVKQESQPEVKGDTSDTFEIAEENGQKIAKKKKKN